jgi:YD repeat-containing protein
VLTTTSGNQTYYNVLTIGGARKQYTVTTESISVQTAFGQSGVSDYSGSLTAIASIALPDGTSYTFNYDSYGELDSITLPTGGTVTLSYQNYLDSYQNQNRWLESYYGGNGSYSFTPSVVTQCQGSAEVGCQEKMTVQDGNGNQVAYLLTLNNGAWNSQMDYYNNNNGTLSHIMSTATAYNFATSCQYYDCNGAQWITASSVTTTLSDTGQTAQTKYAYTYPWLGKPSVVQQWDYYTGTPSTIPTKETDYTYGYFPFVSQVKQLDSNGNLAAQTLYNYDYPAATTVSGLPNHFAYPGYGNVTSVVSGVGTTVTTYSTYDNAGTKLSDEDGNLNTTSYSYSCSDAYRSTVTLPIVVNGSNLQSQSVYDCSSGLVTSTKDPNGVVSGLATTYAYFTSGTNIGRLETVSYPDGGSTNYAYPSSTETDQTVAQTASVSLTSKAFLDTYGRKYQSVEAAPEGSISSETTYGPTGRPNCVTTAHLQGTTSPTDGSTCTFYDVLGRITQTDMPDANYATSTYSGATQTVTDEVGHSKKYTYDAFHRLLSVLEPNASGTLTYETDYQYNALDKLVEVDQWGGAKGATSPGDRQRLFAYDSLGREIAENIPENQSAISPASLTCAGTASGTKWTTCLTYDANSNTKSTTDNIGNVLNYTYDALNRPLTQTQSPSGISYTYKYDGTDGYAHTNPLGQLTYQANSNANAGSSLSYDSMGRLTSENVCVPENCSYVTIPGTTTTTYDSGSFGVVISYGGPAAPCDIVPSYGQGSTAGSLAAALASGINSNCSALLSATVSGSVVTVTATTLGSAADYYTRAC